MFGMLMLNGLLSNRSSISCQN